MAVSAAILAHAPAAFLSLKSPLNRNRPRDKNRTKNAEKPPFQAVFLRKMVGVRGLEPRASCSQTGPGTFVWRFWAVFVLSYSGTFDNLSFLLSDFSHASFLVRDFIRDSILRIFRTTLLSPTLLLKFL